MKKPDTRTRAQRNKALRVDSLREQLASQGHLQHVIEMANKLADVDTELEPDKVARLKIAIDAKMKIVAKYAPDLKSTDIQVSGQIDSGVDATAISAEDWALVDAVRKSLKQDDNRTLN